MDWQFSVLLWRVSGVHHDDEMTTAEAARGYPHGRTLGRNHVLSHGEHCARIPTSSRFAMLLLPLLLLAPPLPPTDAGAADPGGGDTCPPADDPAAAACPCYKFEDGLFLECPGASAAAIRQALERVAAPVHSLSVYDLDHSLTELTADVF
ncbi:GL16457, partial [Gryllus bimaculatus]